MNQETTPVLEMRGIVKRFPGVVANDNVDLTLRKGEVLALLGENGAGKTTLMNVLYGLYRPDEGEIRLRGDPVDIANPSQAISLGLGMVHQHFMLVPVMTVTENMIIGQEVMGIGPFLNRKKAAKKLLEISEQYGLKIDPDAMVGNLPVGSRQRVEILKALYRGAEILILDEPTAVLTPEESESLFKTLETLRGMGKSVIFITHKLREVMRIASHIMVLRGGRLVHTTTPDQTSQAELAAQMVGRDMAPTVEKPMTEIGGNVLEISELWVKDDRGIDAVRGVDLEIRAGEIYGLAGVQGNGQTELVEALTGLRDAESGIVLLDGKDVTNMSARRLFKRGLGHVPEDRHEHAMVEDFPISDNLVISSYRNPPFCRGVNLNHREIYENAETLTKEFDIRTPDVLTTVGSLSGGNQQKVVIARELSRPLKFLIAAQPTRGLDVGSARFIHERILEEAKEGAAVLLVSTELDEILTLVGRIGVMYKGKIIQELEAKTATRESVGLWMAGGDSAHGSANG